MDQPVASRRSSASCRVFHPPATPPRQLAGNNRPIRLRMVRKGHAIQRVAFVQPRRRGPSPRPPAVPLAAPPVGHPRAGLRLGVPDAVGEPIRGLPRCVGPSRTSTVLGFGLRTRRPSARPRKCRGRTLGPLTKIGCRVDSGSSPELETTDGLPGLQRPSSASTSRSVRQLPSCPSGGVRRRIRPAAGGEPARASSSAMNDSRRLNAWYRTGKYPITTAKKPNPVAACATAIARLAGVVGVTSP